MLFTMNAHTIDGLITALDAVLQLANENLPSDIKESVNGGYVLRAAADYLADAKKEQLRDLRMKTVAGAVVVRTKAEVEGTLYVEVDCLDDYQTYKALPDVLEVDGRIVGKSAFNSDRHVAYYRSDLLVALARKVTT